jgi:hypothetical protein
VRDCEPAKAGGAPVSFLRTEGMDTARAVGALQDSQEIPILVNATHQGRSAVNKAASIPLSAVVLLAASIIFALPTARAADSAPAAGPLLSPIFGLPVPDGYREWPLVAVSHRTDNKDELRAILANPVAFKALRDGTLPLPDGAVLAKLAWKREPMTEFEGAFRPGAAPRIEFMYKDAKRFPATGGWGFARFVEGKPADEVAHQTCFPCHEAKVKGHDFVFTRFAP